MYDKNARIDLQNLRDLLTSGKWTWTPHDSIGSLDGMGGCLLNAIGHLQAEYAELPLQEVTGDPLLYQWNDRQTSVDAIIAAIDKAISLCDTSQQQS